MELEYDVDTQSITVYVISEEEPPDTEVAIKVEDPHGNTLINESERFNPPDINWNFWMADLYYEAFFQKGKHKITATCGAEEREGFFEA